MTETIKKDAAPEKKKRAAAGGSRSAKKPSGASKAPAKKTAPASKRTEKKPAQKSRTAAVKAAPASKAAGSRTSPKPKAGAKRTATEKPVKVLPAVKGKHLKADSQPKGGAAARKRSASGARSMQPKGAGQRARTPRKRAGQGDLFLERKEKPWKKTGGKPPKGRNTWFGALNACLLIGIAVLVALGIRQQGAYAEFVRMRDVVDQQTFYEGTTVEGVDVSRMTLSNAMDYWRDRVEPRYAGRAVQLDNGATVTAAELGYTSDYEAVLSAAWSAGRSGSLEQRYQMASQRRENPVAYRVTRVDYSDSLVEQFVGQVAEQVDEAPVDADVQSFNAETYEFVFAPSREGHRLDVDALKQSIEQAIRDGGGSVALQVIPIAPSVTTEEVESKYGLINYAITNASSSSKARLNNIKLAMSFLNGYRVAPGETFSFNEAVGERTSARGFRKATAYSGGDVTEQVGGGICQVSTTLFNAAVKADMEIVERHNHSLTVAYVDKGKDATVNWGNQDFRFKNTSEDDIFICCYLTEDKRVRFGIFGRLLPNGETITVETVTTEVIKYETEYQPTPLLGPGEMSVLQKGRNGYKAEAYKVRWDADGNQLSKELLCKSIYQKKNEIIQYGV